jgi:hypothetical protein
MCASSGSRSCGEYGALRTLPRRRDGAPEICEEAAAQVLSSTADKTLAKTEPFTPCLPSLHSDQRLGIPMTNVVRNGMLVASAVFLLLDSAAAQGQTVRGRVMDESSGAGLAGAEVSLWADGRLSAVAIADSGGAFTMRAPGPGSYRLAVVSLGYVARDSVPVELQRGQTAQLTLRLRPAPLQLDSLAATASVGIHPRHLPTFDGFLVRRHTAPPVGHARVVTRHDPEMRSAITVADVLKWFRTPNKCIDAYYDGYPLSRPLGSIAVIWLNGVEFYSNPLYAPLGFRTGGPCAIVVLWSDHPQNRLPPQP